MILGRDLSMDLVLYMKISKHVITGDDIPYLGCMATIVDLSYYRFRPLNI